VSATLSELLSRLSGDVFFYGNASHGLKDVLTWLQEHRPRPRPNVVMPAYLPAKLYRTILAAGYSLRCYDITPACEFDSNAIAGLLDEDTQAIVVIHYFGLPADLTAVRELATRRGVYLIEDCALALSGESGGRLLGTVGDCALFSVRKMLLLPEGGFMVMNRAPWPFTPSYTRPVSSLYSAHRLLQTRSKRLYSWLARGADPLGIVRCPETGYIRLSEQHRINVTTISRLTHAVARAIDLEKVARRRRANYLRLLEGLRDVVQLEPLRRELPGGAVPYSLPVRIVEGQRDAVREELRQLGVGCGAGWPESPFDDRARVARELSRTLLELPIHHLVSPRQITRVIEHFHDRAPAPVWV
jgi:dTDP-4-amino-4,6-dideoxygalactose transaminase